ncbi:hypothetical protein GCM10010885_21380 [Alicyclobacillus cellulosilyticus]|uniref:AAA domain-containing protein n=1 Tax=Alicyclobacillus cellulosilyticus TaxID=1003997 RepID=A0A917KF19_9BACL|nr:hypothetical protein [Alicyclobacillus cellulosilyticus]GGJ11785.1 hypothetical protein GCM10010885_21380 [Alicyclobacillus cellulosilyticus]
MALGDLRFDTALDRARAALAAWDGLAAWTAAVTLIRDVQGRITVFLEPRRAVAEDEPFLEGLQRRLAADLGPYFSGDVWIANPADAALASMEAIIRAERVPAPWDGRADGGMAWYVLERRIAKEYWHGPGAAEAWPWSSAEVRAGRRPAIVTFYSYKGGMGRTATLAAAALVLAQRGCRVAMVDLDLEAPGLSSLFVPDDAVASGVIDYLMEKPLRPDWQAGSGVVTIADPRLALGDAPLWLVPAGRVNEHYLEKLARIDFQHQVSDRLPRLMKQFFTELADAYAPLDFILLDARAGFHDLGGLALTRLAHAVVLLANLSRPTWAGLPVVLQRLAGSQAQAVPVVLVYAGAPNVRHAGADADMARFRAMAEGAYLRVSGADGADAASGKDASAVPVSAAPFATVALPWHEALRGEVRLWGDAADDTARIRNLVAVLTGAPYQELVRRLLMCFRQADGEA